MTTATIVRAPSAAEGTGKRLAFQYFCNEGMAAGDGMQA